MAEDQEARQNPDPAGDAAATKRKWMKGPALWTGALVTAVITGVAVTLASNFANDAVSGGNESQTPTGPPVAVLSESLQPDPMGSTSYAFARSINMSAARLSSLNRSFRPSRIGLTNNIVDNWARSHDGVSLDRVYIRLVLAGNRNYAVRILNIVPVGTCTAPLTGAIFWAPLGGGVDDNVRLGLNLDSHAPVARAMAGAGHVKGSYFASKTVSLKYQEQQVFNIIAFTKRHFCQFRLRLTILDGTKTVRETIGNGSHPFLVSALIFDPDSADPLRAYKQVYVGGWLSQPCQFRFVRVNPAKFNDSDDVC